MFKEGRLLSTMLVVVVCSECAAQMNGTCQCLCVFFVLGVACFVSFLSMPHRCVSLLLPTCFFFFSWGFLLRSYYFTLKETWGSISRGTRRDSILPGLHRAGPPPGWHWQTLALSLENRSGVKARSEFPRLVQHQVSFFLFSGVVDSVLMGLHLFPAFMAIRTYYMYT